MVGVLFSCLPHLTAGPPPPSPASGGSRTWSDQIDAGTSLRLLAKDCFSLAQQAYRTAIGGFYGDDYGYLSGVGMRYAFMGGR